MKRYGFGVGSLAPRGLRSRFRKWIAATVGATLLTSSIATTAFAISKEEIMTLAKLGIAEDEIIKAIDKDKTVFDLPVAEIP